MSNIDRYRKKGGFMQLLQLIETSGTAKQEKFLQMIKEESPIWEEALRLKMLSMDKILTWPEPIITELMSQMNELTLGTALVGLGEEFKNKVYKSMSASQKRRIDVIIDEKKGSNSAEHTAAFIKILQEVREMFKNKRLKYENIDPQLEIPEDIESLLAQDAYSKTMLSTTDFSPSAPKLSDAPTHAPSLSSTAAANKQHAEDLADLQKRLQFLTQENNNLRLKVRQLEGKLDQIRNIA